MLESKNPYLSPAAQNGTADPNSVSWALPTPYQRVLLRTAARTVDTLLVGIPFLIFHLAILPEMTDAIAAFIPVMLGVLAFPLYFAICHHLWGKTLGKRLLRLQLVDGRGGLQLPLVRAFLREACFSLSAPFYLWLQWQSHRLIAAEGKTIAQLPVVQESIAQQYPALSHLASLFDYGYPVLCMAFIFFDIYGRAIHDLVAGTTVFRRVRTGN